MKKKTKIGTVLCCSTALVSIMGGYLLGKNLNLFNFKDVSIFQKEENNSSELETNIDAEDMSVKLLNKTVNQDGSTSYTYSYVITPESSTRKDISGQLSFVDNTEGVSNYLTFSIDVTNMTFTITKHADFSHQAQLVLSCNANPSINATITLDCKQHFLGYSNVNQKNYQYLLDEDDVVTIDYLKNDGANEIDADNFSTEYTIPTDTAWRVSGINVTSYVYLTGNDVDDMDDAPLVIDNTYSIRSYRFAQDFSIDNIQELLNLDTPVMPETRALEFSNNAYFGVRYNLAISYNTANVIKVFNATVTMLASTADLEFNLPETLTVEESHIIFENVISSVRFMWTDAAGNTSYLDTLEHETGWYYLDKTRYVGGFINIELTRTLDGETLGEPVRIYSDNYGKGIYTGNDTTKVYILFNPGVDQDISWTNERTAFADNLISATELAYTINNN